MGSKPSSPLHSSLEQQSTELRKDVAEIEQISSRIPGEVGKHTSAIYKLTNEEAGNLSTKVANLKEHMETLLDGYSRCLNEKGISAQDITAGIHADAAAAEADKRRQQQQQQQQQQAEAEKRRQQQAEEEKKAEAEQAAAAEAEKRKQEEEAAAAKPDQQISDDGDGETKEEDGEDEGIEEDEEESKDIEYEASESESENENESENEDDGDNEIEDDDKNEAKTTGGFFSQQGGFADWHKQQRAGAISQVGYTPILAGLALTVLASFLH